MKKQKLRPLGEITNDLEQLYEELIDGHDLQFHEILGLLVFWAQVHRPDCFEIFTKDGSSPVLKYGHKDNV